MPRRSDALLAAGTPASKLRPPRVRHAELTRSAILDDDRLAQAEVLAIAAPAGFGKSTLAIEWASRSERPVVWLTCDETNSDEFVLLTDLRAALLQSVPGYQAPERPVTLEEPAYSRQVLPGFLRSVDALPGPVSMVLDDAHLVSGDRARHVLRAFVNALPIGSQIALVGRSLQGLPLPLWRGQGRVVDIGVQDLSFSAHETREALQDFTSEPIPEDELERIQQATRGWPVAVYLMSQAGIPRDGLASIEDFIEAEVLAAMPATLRDFVVETAVFGTVNADLSKAVTGQQRAAHYLGEAITTVLMQRTHDGWYRYHPLLQECATDLLEREDPERLRRVRAAAATWYLAHEHIEQAVRCALASGDRPTQGAVLWPAARISLLQGRTATVQQWLREVGDDGLLQDPALGMAAAWTNLTVSDFGNVLRFGEATLRHMPAGWQEDLAASEVGPHLAMLMAVSGQGVSGMAEAAELALAAVTAMQDADPTRALGSLIAGFRLALVGDPRALGTMAEAAAIAHSVGIGSSEVEALAMLGLLQMAAGDDTAGCESIEAAQACYAFHDLGQMTSTAGVLAIARVALSTFRRREIDTQAAIESLQRIRPSLERVFPWYRPLAGTVLAFTSVRLGDLDGYRTYISWADECSAEGGALCRNWAVRAEQEFAAASPLRHLSPAELRVWDLLRGRMTLSEIAEALFLSRETVKTHTVSIYRKLGVSSRREAQDLAESWS